MLLNRFSRFPKEEIMTVLTRWDPLREAATMQNRLNRFVRELYSPEGPEEALTTTGFAPPVDVYEDEHNITLKIEVPGITKKTLTSASRTTPLPSTASASSRRKRKRRTSVASSGSTEASPARSRCRTRWTRGK